MTVALDETAYAKALNEYSPRPIHDDIGNERAIAMLQAIDELDSPTTEQQEIANLLATLIEAYQQKYIPREATPLEVLQELMAANDLKQKDIAELLGSKGNVSQVFSGERRISRTMAHKLSERFHVPHTLFL